MEDKGIEESRAQNFQRVLINKLSEYYKDEIETNKREIEETKRKIEEMRKKIESII